MQYHWDFSIVWRYRDVLASGLLGTALLTLLAVALGTLLAIGILALRQSRFGALSLTARCFVELFRDLPVLVVIFWLFFCLPILLGRSPLLSPFNVAIVALGLNFSALMADILRSGYEAIPSGELEVARSFGFSRWRILRHIILPQAFWRSLAPALGQAVNTLKLSSLASFISVPELFYKTSSLIQETFRPLEFYTVLALLYLVLILPLSMAVQLVERRLNQRFQYE